MAPEAQVGGPIGLVRDGDVITIDADTLGIDVAADELAPGPPRKAYDSFARPRDGEPT